MQAEHLEGLFHHEIDPLHEITLMIRGKRQIEGFELLRLEREAGGCHVDRATEISSLFLVNQRPANVPFVPRYYLEQWKRGKPVNKQYPLWFAVFGVKLIVRNERIATKSVYGRCNRMDLYLVIVHGTHVDVVQIDRENVQL